MIWNFVRAREFCFDANVVLVLFGVRRLLKITHQHPASKQNSQAQKKIQIIKFYSFLKFFLKILVI